MDGTSGPDQQDERGKAGGTWPPSFPHREIDELIDRLEAGVAADHEDAHRLLVLVAREVQRLRATAVRLVSAKLSAAEQEAQQILAQAADEGERLMAAARESIRIQDRAARLGRVCVEPIRIVSDQSSGPLH